jgi:hypothetical protein
MSLQEEQHRTRLLQLETACISASVACRFGCDSYISISSMKCGVDSELVRSARAAETQLAAKIAASKAVLLALEGRAVVAAAVTTAAVDRFDLSNKELAAAVTTCRSSIVIGIANLFDRKPTPDAREEGE